MVEKVSMKYKTRYRIVYNLSNEYICFIRYMCVYRVWTSGNFRVFE